MSATASQTERFCRQWRRADDANRGNAQRAEQLQSFDHWYSPVREGRRLDRVLFPDGAFPHDAFPGAPEQPAAAPPPNERLDMAYAIGVLMGNRDLVRRLAAGEQVGT